MQRLSRLHVSGFRRLGDLDLALHPLTVLIGANGAGKTSLLDIISLLSASASGRLQAQLSEMGGLSSLLTLGRASSLSVQATMDVTDSPACEYGLTLETSGMGYAISREALTQQHEGYTSPLKHIDAHHRDVRYSDPDEEKLGPPTWEHSPFETSLSQVPKRLQWPERFRRALASATQYGALDVGPRAPVKLPQSMRPCSLPGESGEDIAPLLYYLRETDEEVFEIICDTLAAAFSDFEKLGFPPVAAGMLSVTWKDRRFNSPLYTHQLSEGTLRFLWLVTLLQSPGLTTITMIDEPEVSLHPELLSLLVELFREASHRTQLVIATHSDRLVRFLKPEEVVAMDIGDDGLATATWGDAMDLDRWLADYSLDELWQSGRMGGRPCA